MNARTWGASLAVAVASTCMPTLSHSKDIHVPADQPTIQQGIDASEGGDRVLVAPGQYDELIDFHGKNIQLIGTGGPS
ncbi:MAG TPA: hypothetical protein VH328_03305, partial [Burkholderiaceae bacterium]|nr:hypothetical protein [Burkholderiaceae bacterium]